MVDVLFALDEPHYHTVRFNEPCRFRGAALALSGSPIRIVRLSCRDQVVIETDVNLPCPEFAFLQVQNAATSRYEFMAAITDDAPTQIWGGDAETIGSLLFEFDPSITRDDRLQSIAAAVAALQVPGSDLLIATQGRSDASSYRDSIVSSFFTTELLLRRAGVRPESIRSVLDVGCGTGRSLLGWHLSDPGRRTVGIDINAELIAWNNRHLRSKAEWYQFPADPPIPIEEQSFDLIMLTSVLTHLPLASQRAWIREVERLLTPNGVAIVTMHGLPYVTAILDRQGRELFESVGYAEGIGGAPGASDFSTFHTPKFAVELVRPLETIAIYPMGRPSSGAASWFPMAAWQDIYVLQKQSG